MLMANCTHHSPLSYSKIDRAYQTRWTEAECAPQGRFSRESSSNHCQPAYEPKQNRPHGAPLRCPEFQGCNGNSYTKSRITIVSSRQRTWSYSRVSLQFINIYSYVWCWHASKDTRMVAVRPSSYNNMAVTCRFNQNKKNSYHFACLVYKKFDTVVINYTRF